MFSGLVILVAEDDRSDRELIERCSHTLSFKTLSVTAVMDGIDALPKADIFIMDLELANGDATPLLEKWVRDNGGPCCVCSDHATSDLEADLIVAGAWNVLHKPCRIDALQATLHRYGVIAKRERAYIELQEEYRTMKKKLKTVERRQFALAMLTITSLLLALGKAAWPAIVELLKFF